MGVVTIRVPPDIEVELAGDAITWSFEPGEPRSSAAVRGHVRITGRAVLGKVDVRLLGRRSEPFALG